MASRECVHSRRGAPRVKSKQTCVREERRRSRTRQTPAVHWLFGRAGEGRGSCAHACGRRRAVRRGTSCHPSRSPLRSLDISPAAGRLHATHQLGLEAVWQRRVQDKRLRNIVRDRRFQHGVDLPDPQLFAGGHGAGAIGRRAPGVASWLLAHAAGCGAASRTPCLRTHDTRA